MWPWTLGIYALALIPALLLLRLLARLQRAEDRYAADPARLNRRELGLARRGRRMVAWFLLILTGQAVTSLTDPPGAAWIRWALTGLALASAAVIVARVARAHPDALLSPRAAAWVRRPGHRDRG